MDQFEDAVSDRLDEIDGMGSPPPEVSKEGKALLKVLSALEGYAGGTDKADLGLAAKTVAGAAKASMSPLVADGTAAALEGLGMLAGERRNAATTGRDSLTSAANIVKVDAAIAKADAIVTVAEGEADRGKAAKAWVKAVAAYEKARLSAEKLLAKEAAAAAKNPTLTCQWAGVSFAGDKDATAAAWNSGTGGFGLTAQMSGSTRYLLTAGVAGVFGPGTYTLLGGSGGVSAIQGLIPVNNWLITGGSITITSISATSASGTFTFNALSGTTGAISVTNGVFSVPVTQ
jgi:hypothetical protein